MALHALPQIISIFIMDGEIMEKNTRKALKDAYKNRLRIGGIYRISCNNNSSNWVRASTDLQGIKNRFIFSITSNICPDKSMFPEWNQYGATAFSFEILDEIQQKETQTEQEFSEEVNTLLELWNEKEKD